jgi:hypothetical protein
MQKSTCKHQRATRSGVGQPRDEARLAAFHSERGRGGGTIGGLSGPQVGGTLPRLPNTPPQQPPPPLRW